ncbi:hypothetical protein [Reichenbachiella sp. 5M10]|uniref:hypothetical protein n=1 Tax=Reichenbachiella sp. 5M10 TaxID=1889772 RepID=UPI00117ACCE7|nr:hypothetical protein [Reichenbachiella sp. 5M10]
MILLFAESTFAQIQTKEQAIESINWVIDNPQLDSDSELEKKLADLLRWQMSRNPHVEMNVGGMSEIQNTASNKKLFRAIISIYTCSTFINEDYSKTESAVYAINNVLTYYKNALEIDDTLRIEILDEYISYSDSELKGKMKKLSSYK